MGINDTSKPKFLINGKLDVIYDYQVYKSRIEDVTDDYVAMSIPVSEGNYLPLSRGEKIEAVYYYKEGLYKFYSTVVGRKIDRIALILFDIPQKMEKYQRRNFVRIPHIDNISFIKLNDNEGYKDSNEVKVSDGIPVDISGGGLKFLTKENVKIGDILYVTIYIDSEPVRIKGKVVRHSINNDKKNVCGISFIDVDKNDREKIIKFTFTKMRLLRNNILREE